MICEPSIWNKTYDRITITIYNSYSGPYKRNTSLCHNPHFTSDSSEHIHIFLNYKCIDQGHYTSYGKYVTLCVMYTLVYGYIPEDADAAIMYHVFHAHYVYERLI